MLGVLGVVACSGTETDNPANPDLLKEFQASACKKEQTPTSSGQPLVLASEVEGLKCVEWEQSASGNFVLRLLNFEQGCGHTWQGSAGMREGKVELLISDPSCSIAKCGSCMFDFNFELTSVDSAKPLPVRIGFAPCPSREDTTWDYDVTLPIDETPNGILCRFADAGALGWQALARGTCSKHNMPCGGMCQDSPGCDPGLSCSTLGDNDSRCLKNCTTNADCGTNVLSCQEGLCKPADGF